MDRFVSHYMLRLDAKGRVSVPAPFRAVLARAGFEGLYCYPAMDRPALDPGGKGLLTESETRKIAGEGRVQLTETLKAHAAIADRVSFVGLGHKFQIWEPGRFRAEFAEATAKVRAFKQVPGTRMAAAEKPLGARGE